MHRQTQRRTLCFHAFPAAQETKHSSSKNESQVSELILWLAQELACYLTQSRKDVLGSQLLHHVNVHAQVLCGDM